MSENRRSRRAKTKAVDYAKEQDFSDGDVFEDSPNEDPTPKRGGRRRKANRNNDNAMGHDDDLVGGGYRPKKPIFTEKGYDPNLEPIRERFPFLPEYELDGTPRIDLIVGRRPIDEKDDGQGEDNDNNSDEDNGDASEDDDSDAGNEGGGRRGRKRKGKRGEEAAPSPSKKDSKSGPVEYEYLIKYKGRSYLHLEWKTGADLESMNKSAKAMYRRYLKKLAQGMDEDLEDPEFDPSFAVPQKVVAEAEQEFTIELSDKELLKWEKEREKELAEEEQSDSDEAAEGEGNEEENPTDTVEAVENKVDASNANAGTDAEEKKEDSEDDWEGKEIDFNSLTIERLKTLVDKDGPYYPRIEGSTNPYRDGYVTEPPKKPRASYLFFQCTMRSYFAKRNPNATQAELMQILGDQWNSMDETQQEPFVELAREEAKQYEHERQLLEKAQKPNELWQPIRRCLMVLDRLSNDGFASIFLEPVGTDDFPDYLDVIDQPMDLGTVRKKLKNKKYQAPEQFARDMRKIWNNCKIFNRHGSAIWHVADYMSKQFERLYHAWVLDFRERYLRWANPKARPWEHTCRLSDGKCGTQDNEMVLCDHCDAMYGIRCLNPPLKRLPTGIWLCPDCKPRAKSARGTRMISATAEQAARKRAELGDTPKKQIKQKMYLVKWAGLGYECCTWETKADVGNPGLIAEYHKLNNAFPDEPDLREDSVNEVIEKSKFIHPGIAGGNSCIPNLRAELYAQSRAFQFAKFAKGIPSKVCSECGPKTASSCAITDASSAPKDVVECVNDLVFKVSCKDNLKELEIANRVLPPAMAGEYDVVLPITSKGLMMNVGEIHGSVAFLGYRAFPDGSKGPAEKNNLVRNVGDKIVAVDGVSTVNKTFKEVIMMLRESGKNKYAFMRFLENKYAVCKSDLASVGNMGRYAIEELKTKFANDRKKLLVQRSLELLVDDDDVNEKTDEESDGSAGAPSEAESEGSEGEFEPDSDDEEGRANTSPMKPKKSTDEGAGQASDPSATVASDATTDKSGDARAAAAQPNNTQDGEKKSESATAESAAVTPTSADPQTGVDEKIQSPEVETDMVESPVDTSAVNSMIVRSETTQSLAYRLLDLEVGYSSDEGGDGECAYFVDGVDDTFTTMSEIPADLLDGSKGAEEKAGESKKDTNPEEATVPARRNDFNSLGDRSKLIAAVSLSSHPPDERHFENFPLETTKKVQSQNSKNGASLDTETQQTDSPEKAVKRSTVKIEQVNTATNETIHVWASVESAAATLQIPLNELKQVLRGEYDEDIGDEVGGFRWCYAAAGATVTAGNASKNRGSKQGKEAWLEFRDRLYDPNVPHPYKNGNRLRDYQVEGVNWLASTFYRKHGCILADEMGLGKTVQIVSYLEHLYRVEKIQRPFLVVVPLSTVEHWRREFEGWTDMICCVYHDRQRVWRDVMREYEWYYEDRPHTPDYLKFDVLVTTYDTLIGDFDVISQIPFRAAVVDEAHRLRNQKGKLLECMREISAKGTLQHGFQSRVLMSGTPLQNDLNELWTLLNFIEPFKFPDIDEFMHHFGNMANKEQVEALQKKISPYMLRRVKEDVAKDIPAKEETLIDVELTSIQKQYYRAIFEHNHAFLNMGSTRAGAPKLMNIQMELRKVCNHPCLLEGVEHREQDKMFKEFVESGAFENKGSDEQQRMLNEHLYIMTSGKMVLLDKLLPKLRQEGHKVLIFSQMVKMLDLISEYCEFRSFPYERLDGRVRGTDRQKSIDRFEREENSFLFLLSTRAGGVGINLTAADVCIIFDSDWNPQNDVQAQARCHRIGQTKDVRIYRLITSRSFEQEMFDRASKKLGLEQAVLGTFGQDDECDKPTNKEMEQLLKKGAYALLEDDNDEVTKAFCADDIDSILAKRTRTRVVEGTKTASWLNKQGMVVSKSKFTSDSKSADLDMDDPLFWQKVMPDFVTPSIMLQKLHDLSDGILGASGKGRGRGRGRWKRKPKQSEDVGTADAEDKKTTAEGAEDDNAEAKAENEERSGKPNDDSKKDECVSDEDNEEDDDGDASDTKGDVKKYQLTRTNQRKVAKYMSDLKSMIEELFDDDDDESLPKDEKAIAQKLLLTISVKEKLFNEEQRHYARVMLKRLEGSRRRRCRTSDKVQRFSPGKRGKSDEPAEIREELRIVGKKKQKGKRRKRSGDIEVGSEKKRKRKGTDDDSGAEVAGDGYLLHSDDEADWSDVGEDLYQSKKKNAISRKEAKRRRQWAADDDAATAAGRAWPALPRNVVGKVLGTLLEEAIKQDQEQGGVFSVPVPRDEFPEYYEQIKDPMDYGTMKQKLESGEYRSAQAMQKDFILIMQNCLTFNAKESEIVQEARQQALLRPTLLRNAAMKHDLFLAEDGSVLEVVDDDATKKQSKGGDDGGKRKKRQKGGGDALTTPASKKRKGKKSKGDGAQLHVEEEEDDVPLTSLRKKKPRIKISLSDGKKAKKKSRLEKEEDVEEDDGGIDQVPIAKKKMGNSTKTSAVDKVGSPDATPKRRGKKRKAEVSKENVDDEASDDSVPTRRNGRNRSEPPSSRKKPRRLNRDDNDIVDCWGNPIPWKLEREALDDSFKSAKKHFSSRGAWQLPLELKPDKFREVALGTLSKIGRLDRYNVFAEAVSEDDAPGYYDIVSDPIDMSMMKSKVEQGEYGEGSAAAERLYDDFLLMFENCSLYNEDDGEVTEEAARIFFLVPETYATVCSSVLKKQKKSEK